MATCDDYEKFVEDCLVGPNSSKTLLYSVKIKYCDGAAPNPFSSASVTFDQPDLVKEGCSQFPLFMWYYNSIVRKLETFDDNDSLAKAIQKVRKY